MHTIIEILAGVGGLIIIFGLYMWTGFKDYGFKFFCWIVLACLTLKTLLSMWTWLWDTEDTMLFDKFHQISGNQTYTVFDGSLKLLITAFVAVLGLIALYGVYDNK